MQNAHSAVQMRCGRISFFRGEFQQNIRLNFKDRSNVEQNVHGKKLRMLKNVIAFEILIPYTIINIVYGIMCYHDLL